MPITTRDAETGPVLTLDDGTSTADVHAFGAHVTSWVPDDGHGEALFMSRLARLDGKAAIRGGVPVIFPQFGPGAMVKHGFARTMRWTVEALDEAAPAVTLLLRDDAATRATWPHAFALRLRVALDGGLRLTMTVDNAGDAPFDFTGALHAYFRVVDVARVRVHGLEGARYRDQLARADRREGDGPVRIAKAVDRIYADVAGPVVLDDEGTGRRLRLTSAGFADAVVWNPAPEGAGAIDDLGDDEWRTMLCIEPAVAARAATVAPGARWTGTLLVAAGA